VIFSFIITIDEQFHSVYEFFCEYWVVELKEASSKYFWFSFKHTTESVQVLEDKHDEEFNVNMLAEREAEVSCEDKLRKEVMQLKEETKDLKEVTEEMKEVTEELKKELKEMKGILLDMVSN